jgi:hypothetical protein
MGKGYLSEAEIKADYAGLMLLFEETRAILVGLPFPPSSS